MGKHPGFMKRAGIALRKFFWDPLAKGLSSNKTLGQNMALFGRNVLGNIASFADGLEFGLDTLNLDSLPLGGAIENGLEALSLGSKLGARFLNKLGDGGEMPQYHPFISNLDDDPIEAIGYGKQFIDDVNNEYDMKYNYKPQPVIQSNEKPINFMKALQNQQKLDKINRPNWNKGARVEKYEKRPAISSIVQQRNRLLKK